MPMTNAMMAAPNLARIRAIILHVEQSPQFPDKWMLAMEIEEAECLSGPHFARPALRAHAFTIRASWDLPVPVRVEAEAEYLGGARNGVFQLKNLYPCR
ncbi:MAG TPA: hypothetical protein VIM12_12715 [Noviherbaspirillum sp.]|jgi:hypothetical protein|uniref:hypothetical protein n=1 Tax=Noviherbaspirillum sp. TaxID=1926288 RepID=UPI002F92EC23